MVRQNPDKIDYITELRDEPELAEDLCQFVDAFFFLHPCRAQYMEGWGGIPLTEIEAYCRVFREPDPARFCDMIAFLDRIFLGEMRKKSESAKTKPPPKGQPKPKPRRKR